MKEDYTLAMLNSDDPLQLLKSLCEEQGKTTLALEQLEKTQSELLGPLESLDGSGNSGSAFGTAADVAGILAAVETFSDQKLSKLIQSAVTLALTQAAKIPVVAEALAIMAAFAGTFALLNYEMEQGWVERPNMEQMTETMNTVGDIYGASNPFLYQGDDTPKLSDYTPEERGNRLRQNFEARKESRNSIARMASAINQAGGIMAESRTDPFPAPAAFSVWQDNQTQSSAAYDNWQQQTQLAETQTQITQYLQTQTDNSKDQSVALNVTNNFKGVMQDRRSLNDIGEYLARQIMDDLNSGKQLYSGNW